MLTAAPQTLADHSAHDAWCLLLQAGIATERAQLLRDRQKVIAYESINTTFKQGAMRGPDELLGTDKEHADSQDPELSINEREKAL